MNDSEDEEDTARLALLEAGEPRQTTAERTNLFGRCYSFLDGPKPPRMPRDRILFRQTQQHLNEILDHQSSVKYILLWTVFYLAWVGVFGGLVYQSAFAATAAHGEGIEYLACDSTLWQLKNGCGVDGIDCMPFKGVEKWFRCPGDCLATVVLNDRAIGDQIVFHETLVIGGQGETHEESGIYRADSFVCASAIHAGIISGITGGCGKLRLHGEQTHFESSRQNGVASIGVQSNFPKSFSFVKTEELLSGCSDLRWTITIANMLFSAGFSILQSAPLYYFWVLFIMIYFNIAFVSDAPPFTSYALVGRAFQGFLPALFVGYWMWIVAVRHTLKAPSPPLDRTVFWLGGLWFGALLNYISDKIPISRLIMSDLLRDGGIFWAIGLVVLILTIILVQMDTMRKSGCLIYYLKVYLSGLGVLLVLGSIPGLVFRLHHYIFALMFIAGTAFQTRFNMLCQGILVGLFLDGIARWGFHSILETAEALLEDGQLGSAIPLLLPNSDWRKTEGIQWAGPVPLNFYFSLMINEVERYRGPETSFNPSPLGLLPATPYFVRVAYALGNYALDYSKAGVMYANGTIIVP